MVKEFTKYTPYRLAERAKEKRRIKPTQILPMFIAVPCWLLERDINEISQGAKLCYGRLLLYGRSKGEAWPRQTVLGKEIGVTDRQVRKYIEELETLGLIETERFEFRGINHYFFLRHPWIEYVDEDEPKQERIAEEQKEYDNEEEAQ